MIASSEKARQSYRYDLAHNILLPLSSYRADRLQDTVRNTNCVSTKLNSPEAKLNFNNAKGQVTSPMS